MKHRSFAVVPVVMAAVLAVAAPGWAESEDPPPTPDAAATTTTTIETSTTIEPATTTTTIEPASTTATTANATATTDAPPIDPPIAAAATPAIVVTPSTDLLHNQSVTVTGSGYTPNASIGMAQCDPEAAEPADCDLSNVGYATADAAGAWSTSFTVRRVIRNSYETIDCTTAPARASSVPPTCPTTASRAAPRWRSTRTHPSRPRRFWSPILRPIWSTISRCSSRAAGSRPTVISTSSSAPPARPASTTATTRVPTMPSLTVPGISSPASMCAG